MWKKLKSWFFKKKYYTGTIKFITDIQVIDAKLITTEETYTFKDGVLIGIGT